MKRLLIVRLSIVMLAWAWLALPATVHAATIQLSLSPANSAPFIAGAHIDVDVWISGLPDPGPPSVGAFDLTVGYNFAVLVPLEVTFGPFLGDPALFEAITGFDFSIAGQVEFAEVSLLAPDELDTLQPVAFVLATLSFIATNDGSSAFFFIGDKRVDDAFGIKFDVIAEPAAGALAVLALALLLALRRRLARRALPAALAGAAVVLLAAAPGAAPAAEVDPQQIKQRTCISVFRYGGAASGWSAHGTGTGAFPTGTLNSIIDHVNAANQRFIAVNTVKPGDSLVGVNLGDTFRVNVEWVWSDAARGLLAGAIEDLPDPFDKGNGDIRGGPTDQASHLQSVPSSGGSTGSPDIDFILKEVADSECYPVVFVNSPNSGFFGVTYTELMAHRSGVVTLINSNSFPRNETATTFRKERNISTLTHELAHAICLDPPIAGWGNAGGHPPHTDTVNPPTDAGVSGLPPHTPEGRGVKVGNGFADTGSYLRDTATWFTGAQRSGAEAFTLRQAVLGHACLGIVRTRYSPSFTVAAGGASALPPSEIRWAPAIPMGAHVPPPIDLGLPPLDRVNAISYDWKRFPDGRFRFKFAVDAQSRGITGSDVLRRFAMAPAHAAEEFAAPTGIVARPNVQTLAFSQFGLQVGDAVSGLDAISPGLQHADIHNMKAADLNQDGRLDIGSRVYLAFAPGAVGRDPAAVHFALGDGTGAPPVAVYADRTALGLAAGDQIDALCVRDDDNGIYDGFPQDEVLFSLTRASTSVANGTFSSSDVIRARGLGLAPVVAAAAKLLGLRGAAADDLDALKCFTPPKVCDIDRDGRINRFDINFIFRARSTPTTIPGDPRDVDLDGLITVNDARVCTLFCDKPNCEP